MNPQIDPASPAFNWFTALESLKPNDSIEYRIALSNKASVWVTCACGQLCQALPRYDGGAPKDQMLFSLGHTFYCYISQLTKQTDFQKHLTAAQDILHKIESRVAEILSQTTCASSSI